MLKEILAEFDRVDAPLDLKELSVRLNIQKSALQGMMTTLVHQGKLQMDAISGSSTGESTCESVQCKGCSASSRCPFIGKMPTSYSKAKGLPPQGSRTQR